MDAVHVSKTACRKSAQQVQRCRCLRVGLQHLGRIRDPRFRREGQFVDDVTTVAGQFHAIDHLCWGAAWFGELTGHPAYFDHRHLGTISQNHRHLQHDLECIANAICTELFKAFGAIASN